MADQSFLDKLREEFVKAGNSADACAAFVAWSDEWLAKNPPVGTGFAEGTSAITVRFQSGDQYPLSKQATFSTDVRGVQITGQADKSGRGGIVASAAVPITGN
jgi:hypothetical protein